MSYWLAFAAGRCPPLTAHHLGLLAMDTCISCFPLDPRRSQYFESRGGKFDEICFFGLQYFIKRYLCGPVVTQEKIDIAKEMLDNHMGPGQFNEEGWKHILTAHNGHLPISIK